MNEYLIIGLKTVLFLLIILVIIRIMGKRELGQLNVFDIIISFMISEIFSNAIADPGSNVLLALFPIFIIFIIQMLISVIVLKSKRIRLIIESKPSLIIDNGVIDYEEMKKQRYNISDLLQQVRGEGILDITSISYAILESNGTLSVIEKKNNTLKYPFPIISDGKINLDILKQMNLTKELIEIKLNENNIYSIEDVFICFIDKEDSLIIFSKKLNNTKQHQNNK